MDLMEQASTLLAEVGPLANLMAIAEYTDEKAWRLLVEEGLELVVELDTVQAQLILTADVALPRAEDLLPLYKMLLEYGRQWIATGGVHMVLDGDGTVMAVYRVPLSGLERTRLAGSISTFAQTVTAWRRIINEYKGRRSSNPAPSDADPFSLGAIRV